MPTEGNAREYSGRDERPDDFFRRLYDEKAEYIARRNIGSLEARSIELEVAAFKVPNLVAVLPPGFQHSRVVEVGCATGELLAGFPSPSGATKVGFDISQANVQCARARYPAIDFRSGDFREYEGNADIVILSDILEHVPDDRGLLQAAGQIARLVLINLPLEDNWLNDSRNYGPDDVSGHLRRYTLSQGLSLITSAGLQVLHWRQVWIHETPCDDERRRLRREMLGSAFPGGPLMNAAKRGVYTAARLFRPLGRRLFSSNLFVSAALRAPP